MKTLLFAKAKSSKKFFRFCFAESRVDFAIFACEILRFTESRGNRRICDGFCGFGILQNYLSWLFGVGKGERILLFAKAKSSKNFLNLRCRIKDEFCIFLRVRFCKFVDSALDSTNPQNPHKKT